MAPIPNIVTLGKRDESLSAGAIAGIIVGIVVVALLLLALLIWRLLAYRKNLDPYSAKSLDSRAREKALRQTRGGEHIRSTRPRDRDTRGLEDRRNLVSKGEEEEEEVLAGDIHHDSDGNSANGTVNDDQQAITRAKEKQKQLEQGRDYDIYQGHEANAVPASSNYLGSNAQATAADPYPTEKEGEKRTSTLRGCSTM